MAARSSSTVFLQHPLSSATQFPPSDLPNTWILEFILRQPIPDSLIGELLISLPFSSPQIHPHIRKTLLLRRLSADVHGRSLSDRTLHSLELIAQLGRPSHLLKAAYCAAAVECAAAAFLMSGGDFAHLVEKIWMGDAAGGLVTEEFLEWGKKLERCVASGEGYEEFLKRDVEVGVKAVRDYLEEALEEMGPSFLEIVAAEMEEKRMDLDGVGGMNCCFEKLDGNDAQGGDFKGFMEVEAGMGFVLEFLLFFIICFYVLFLAVLYFGLMNLLSCSIVVGVMVH